MQTSATKRDVIQNLQKEILSLQGYKRMSESEYSWVTVGAIDTAFPDKIFPLGAVHEFISHETEDAAATNGFMSAILGQLMQQGGCVLWISTRRTTFPPALTAFGIPPERVIFVDLFRPKEALWAIEEALKCDALTAVVGELTELSFTESRRLQLAVEQSRVTGFIHRYKPRSENAVACLTRWKIKSVPSEAPDGMPGIGFPRWHVQLVKVRSGQPGTWHVEWSEGRFRHIAQEAPIITHILPSKTG